jgi:membrane-bound ClpP family serine protease
MKAIWVIAYSLVLFVTACCIPALEFQRNDTDREIWSGGQALVLGLLGLLMGCLAWLANPLLLIAMTLLFMRYNIPAAVCATLALLISFNTWLVFSLPMPGDEGGASTMKLLKIREGTYVWMLSMAVVLIGAFLVPKRSVVKSPSTVDQADTGKM